MVKISRDDVLKLARLARLQLRDSEQEKFRQEIEAILGYVEQLSTLDLDDLKPTYQVTGLTNVTRPDVVDDYGVSPAELLKNAPLVLDKHIQVKRMIR